MLSTLSILQSFTPRGVIPIKPQARGGKKNYDTAFYNRCQHLMRWLLIWQVPCDRINDAFLANGMVFVRGTYLAQLHSKIRREEGYKTPERFYKSKRIKELEKLGFPFDELCTYHFEVESSKINAQRRYNLKMLLAGQR